MDRISDSGSDGYGSNPYGGTGDGGSAPITPPAAFPAFRIRLTPAMKTEPLSRKRRIPAPAGPLLRTC